MAGDFGSEEIKEMGQLLLRDGSGSVSTHTNSTRGVAGAAFTRAIFYIYSQNPILPEPLT